MAKKQRTSPEGRITRHGSRILDAQDAAEFVIAAREYVAANTATQAAARKKLQELGFIDRSGKPTKHYR